MSCKSNRFLQWPAFASLRTEWSRTHRAGRAPGPEERLESWDFFSSALQGAFDAAGMDHEVEVLSNQLRERGSSEQRVANPVLEQEIDDEVGELVSVTGSESLRDQARQAGAVVERLGLVEDRTRESERLSHLGDGGPLDANAAKHLVLDLHQVARVEELAPEEQGVGHLLGVGIQDALVRELFTFGGQGWGHGGLRGLGFV